MSTALRPEFGLDFTAPEINANPWPHLEEVREIGRAVFNPPSDSWFITSYDDVRAVLANDRDFGPAAELFAEIFGDPTVLGADEPRHTELRRVWGPHLMRKAVSAWSDLVSEVADEQLAPVLDGLRSGEVVDVVQHLRMIPTEVIARMIGVPKEDCGLFTQWGRDMVLMFDAYTITDEAEAARMTALGNAATTAMLDYSGEVLEARRRSGQTDDLLGALAATDVEMTEHEKKAYVTIFIEGAQDTTTKFMSSTLTTLARHPDQRKLLVEDREHMAAALEEVMRWHGVVSADLRIARGGDARVGDVLIPDGDHVSTVFASANRDVSRWENPDAFDITRESKSNLGFGFGTHNCMGVNMARLVTTIVIGKILDVAPEYQLATDTVDYGRSFLIRGPLQVPLAL